ncbi:helix-loop-helix DNA-binding domain-containing transcription factor [Phycomyces blakesleeanus NRRL 1555(-)]|uniref:Helix-loop-helix DNA-binding domain-containing transcription factor n=1 Tax=Phycomyces blakesleeanus (strain ATCC 8743b / DSM 1359 / FGSC 10004 / NBRC 33097 / NRRL 1555) TaxID=763407 RepID=A0A162N8M0_PHYB8|nr:helix-loop-helix DNA-binding domain-containing transcription factor [Phycomyces blakesleeanus NRRL 1555(-)]OAD72118.1 helix-loop-helix DNA-binding domain-containing transcription factor [Phycomyces blakesleeanus NRRL 1555(-)]|eukprot:XP_018290158.1 helix-loop-helix DNA-binding domain-containing transcription factor [Phycomyces blakesleeanus NRRL 1555(-)]
MDMSGFQLDGINDMDMLRSLSNRHSQDQDQSINMDESSSFDHFSKDIDLLFQTSHASAPTDLNSFLSPYQSTANTPQKLIITSTHMSPLYPHPHLSSNPVSQEFMDQDDIFTPLVSPAMTPSFTYQLPQKHHPNIPLTTEMDFSPLSSPAIMPQLDRQHSRDTSGNPIFGSQFSATFDKMSSTQICEQYEQLEQAKIMITRKLSELQQKQQQHLQQKQQQILQQQQQLQQQHQLQIQKQQQAQKKAQMQVVFSQTVQLPPSYTEATSPTTMAYTMQSFQPAVVPEKPSHLEPVTPASLMNMKMQSLSIPPKRLASTNQPPAFAPILTSQIEPVVALSHSLSDSSTQSLVLTPTDTPKTPPRSLSAKTTRGSTANSAGHKKISSTHASDAAPRPVSKKQRRESTLTHTDTKSLISPSPRALKPLLLSPTLTAGLESSPTRLNAERILATRSNYQNLMEGKAAALGIAFMPHIKSGIEVRRTAHKAAEQKRRDSLKEWFERLRREVEDGYVKKKSGLASIVIREQEREARGEIEDTSGGESSKTRQSSADEADHSEGADESDAVLKPLSKVLLLRYAYEYISTLKTSVSNRDLRILELEEENARLRQGSASKESSPPESPYTA